MKQFAVILISSLVVGWAGALRAADTKMPAPSAAVKGEPTNAKEAADKKAAQAAAVDGAHGSTTPHRRLDLGPAAPNLRA